MKISVYITSYNQKEFLTEAIESVLNQTLMPFEIIIVDDDSNDGSVELIRSYHAKYPELIKTHMNTENLGIAKCRNIALSLVTGSYITALDGDDAYLPRKLEVQAQLARSTGANLIYTNFYFAQDDIENLTKIWCSNTSQLPTESNIFTEVISRSFPYSALFRYELVKADLLKNVGGYDESLDIYEDFDFRIRLAKEAVASFTFEALSIYRLHGDGLSRAPKQKHLDTLKFIYNKYSNDIDSLSEVNKRRVEQTKSNLFSHFENSTKSKKVSILKRVKRKLKILLNNKN